MRVYKSNHYGFSTIELEWQDYRLTIVPSLGGRILGYTYQEHPIFYVSRELMGKIFDLTLQNGETIDEKRKKLGMKLYGGFKTWLAPQSLWQNAPYIDLDLGNYTSSITESDESIQVTLESPICRQTQMQFIRRVTTRRGQEEVEIDMGMKNHGKNSVTYGLWDVTQINSPGVARFYSKGERTVRNLMGTQVPLLWVSDDILEVPCGQEYGVYKVGTSDSSGDLLSVVATETGNIGYLKRFEIFDNKSFGHGCAVEVYNSADYPYFEAEVHAPLTPLDPNESFYTKQTWKCFNLSN